VSQDGGDIFVGELAGKAVGGEEIEIAGLRVVAGDVGLYCGLGADGAGDEVAHGRLGGLLGRDLAGAELLFDEGVVVGELLEVATSAAVTSAVANVDEPEGGGVGGAGVGMAVGGRGVEKGDERGAHAGELW